MPNHHDIHFRAFLHRVKGLAQLYLSLILPQEIVARIIWETLTIEAESLLDLIAGS